MNRMPKSAFVRGSALFCLVGWLAALGFCDFEPLWSHVGHCADHPPASATPAMPEPPQGQGPANSGEETCCDELLGRISARPVAVIQPKGSVAPAILLVVDLSSHATNVQNLLLRQITSSDWVFTPEVCLGPAFRSLAPPSLI